MSDPITREFRASGFGARVVLRRYPPSPTVWLWLCYDTGLHLQTEAPSAGELRAAMWTWGKMKADIGGGAFQDFVADVGWRLEQMEATVGNG